MKLIRHMLMPSYKHIDNYEVEDGVMDVRTITYWGVWWSVFSEVIARR